MFVAQCVIRYRKEMHIDVEIATPCSINWKATFHLFRKFLINQLCILWSHVRNS